MKSVKFGRCDRTSDFNSIKNESVKDGFIHLNTGKTGTPIVVPIHKQIEEIMGKYKGVTINSLPKPLSNQKFNEYIKDVCKKIDSFKVIELVYKTIGGKKQVIKTPRFNRVSSHCGRRTFATINYENKVPMISIMAITGHKTSVTFLKYVKTDPKKHAEILASYWK